MIIFYFFLTILIMTILIGIIYNILSTEEKSETKKKDPKKVISLEEKTKTKTEALKKLEEKNKTPDIYAGKIEEEKVDLSNIEKKLKAMALTKPQIFSILLREWLKDDTEFAMAKKNKDLGHDKKPSSQHHDENSK